MIVSREDKPEHRRMGGRYRVDPLSGVSCLAVSAISLFWITLANGGFEFGATIFLAILPWVSRAGSICTRVLGRSSFWVLDLIVGMAVSSIAMMVWKLLVPVSLWVFVILLLFAVTILPRFLPGVERQKMTSWEFLAVLTGLIAATGWSQELISPTRVVSTANLI